MAHAVLSPFPNHPEIQLLPEGAAFASDCGTLVVADVHLGKSATFRARGLAVPEGDMERDFSRLMSLAHKCQAQRLVIAGDFFHAPAGVTPELEQALGEFLNEIGIPMLLVEGNHDRKLKQLPHGIQALPFIILGGGVRIVHNPADVFGNQLHLTGHWHPAVRIRDGNKRILRIPCFLHRETTVVLPAFGSFTGGAIFEAKKDDKVFITLRDSVIEIPWELIK
jgi:DNA ligase-associated metallophosphoesterase